VLDRKTIIRIITFCGGLFFLLEFLIPGSGDNDENFLTLRMTKFNDLLMVVAAMAFMLGPINLIRSNLSKMVRSRKEWLMPILFFAGLLFGIFAGICYWTDAKMQDLTADSSKVKSSLDEWVLSSGGSLVLYSNIAIYGIGLALGGSSMGMLAFYLVSAAYRAFRLSNLDAGIMMFSAVIVLLGMVPLGAYITYNFPDKLQLSTWARWIMDVPNTAVQRAVLIGAVAGVFGAGLRQWLGLGKAQE
jgi:hypothetical protein